MATGLSSRMLYPLELCATKGLICIPGSAEMNGISDPVNARGDGFSVSRTGVGEYLITFPELYPMMVSIVGSFEDEDGQTDDDTLITFEPYDSTAGTVAFRVTVASILTDFDGERVNFVAYMQKYNAHAITHA